MKLPYTSGIETSKKPNTLNPATVEKHELLRKLVSGEMSSASIGKKFVALDEKYRTEKLKQFATILGFAFLLISPFVRSAGPATTTSRY